MGYRTYFELEIVVGQLDPEDLAENFERITDYNINDLSDIGWYDWEIHMCELSKLYPDVVFRLYGDGEESDDVWHAYFCNGDYEIEYMELPDIDYKKLDGIIDRNPELFI